MSGASRFAAGSDGGGFVVTQCLLCRHLAPGADFRCTAFPAGVPGEIVANEADHRRPFVGDKGIRFEADPAAPAGALAALDDHFKGG